MVKTLAMVDKRAISFLKNNLLIHNIGAHFEVNKS
jgi:hypothetical protein